MDWLKSFSADFGTGVSAIGAIGTLILAGMTLSYLKREHENKFRPRVVPEILLDELLGNEGFSVGIIPRSLGEYPCEFRLSDLKLTVGDEVFETSPAQEWMLIGGPQLKVLTPIGHVRDWEYPGSENADTR